MNGAYKLHPALMLDISPQASEEVLDQQTETLGQTKRLSAYLLWSRWRFFCHASKSLKMVFSIWNGV